MNVKIYSRDKLYAMQEIKELVFLIKKGNF